MDDMKISLSVPATIYSFGETERPLTLNKYVTHAKLKIFYIGKTPDNRVFTKQFSDQLLQSLPGTPVVAYYSEEKKDFIGHNMTQYVFGYVPEMATIEYRTENNTQFAVTDVLLFTGRNDNIGEIANRIIGQPHSLELDPSSIEYEIVRANGKIDSITFRKGNFIGLSVLGTSEKPAFTGSEFFTENSDLEVFVNSYREFKSEVESYKSGGQEMNEEKDTFLSVDDTAVEETKESIESENLSNPEASFVDNEPVIIGEDREPGMDPYADVAADPALAPKHVVEAAPMEDNSWEEHPMHEGPEEEGPATEEPAKEIEVVVKVEEEPEEDIEDTGELAVSDMPVEVEKPKLVLEEVSVEPMSYAEPAVEKAEGFPTVVVSKEEVDVKQPEKETWEPEKVAHASTLDDAERQELNAYRKASKFELIESYSALSEDIKNKFKADHEKFTLAELDKELAYELVKSQRQMKQSEIKMFSMPSMSIEAPKTKQDALKQLIEQYKDKK